MWLCGVELVVIVSAMKISRALLATILTSCVACAPGVDRAMRTFNTVMVIETSAAIACDYGQTMWAGHDGAWDRRMIGSDGTAYFLTEQNPLLGPTPSNGTIAVASGLGAALGIAVYRAPLPVWLKAMYFLTVGIAENYVVFASGHYQRQAGGHGACGF